MLPDPRGSRRPGDRTARGNERLGLELTVGLSLNLLLAGVTLMLMVFR